MRDRESTVLVKVVLCDGGFNRNSGLTAISPSTTLFFFSFSLREYHSSVLYCIVLYIYISPNKKFRLTFFLSEEVYLNLRSKSTDKVKCMEG